MSSNNVNSMGVNQQWLQKNGYDVDKIKQSGLLDDEFLTLEELAASDVDLGGISKQDIYNSIEEYTQNQDILDYIQTESEQEISYDEMADYSLTDDSQPVEENYWSDGKTIKEKTFVDSEDNITTEKYTRGGQLQETANYDETGFQTSYTWYENGQEAYTWEYNPNDTKMKKVPTANGEYTTSYFNAKGEEISQTEYFVLNNEEAQLVPQDEWELAYANNIDITETMEDGSPRYIIAQGDSDETWHVYDLSTNQSLAQMYGENGGSNLINENNTTLQSFNFTNSSSGKVVYSIDSEGKTVTQNANYSTTPAPSDPLVFDVNGDGIKTTNEKISYDIDGDGKKDTINNTSDAVLVFDGDKDGVAGEDGSELFGDNTDLDGDGVADGHKDGFEALRALALREGLIDENDTKLDTRDLKFLEQKYGLQIKLSGYESEATSLEDAGITEINLSDTGTVTEENFDGKGNDLQTQEGATFVVNGEEREYADLWHVKHEEE